MVISIASDNLLSINADVHRASGCILLGRAQTGGKKRRRAVGVGLNNK